MMNTYSGSPVLRAGEVTQTWCRHHGRLVDHLYTGHSLECVECREDSKNLPPKPQQDGRRRTPAKKTR